MRFSIPGLLLVVSLFVGGCAMEVGPDESGDVGARSEAFKVGPMDSVGPGLQCFQDLDGTAYWCYPIPSYI